MGLPHGVQWQFTSRHDGDLSTAGDPVELAVRRSKLVVYPWTWLNQVHGMNVVAVNSPSEGCGQDGDALVSEQRGAVLAVHGADCAPVLCWGDNGVIGAAHAGWRGLEAGVLQRLVAAMRSRGAVEVSAVLGPCIHVECYEFGPLELAGLLERYGPSVAGRSRQGLPALDLVAGVARALQEVDVAVDTTPSRCTSCHGDLYSWRARADRGRLAGIIWREP